MFFELESRFQSPNRLAFFTVRGWSGKRTFKGQCSKISTTGEQGLAGRFGPQQSTACRRWIVFGLDEIGQDLGVVDILGPVDRGQGVRTVYEVVLFHYIALFQGDGHVAEAGFLVAAGLVGFGACSESGVLMWAV